MIAGSVGNRFDHDFTSVLTWLVPSGVIALLLAILLAFGEGPLWLRFVLTMLVATPAALLAFSNPMGAAAWALALAPLGVSLPGVVLRLAGFRLLSDKWRWFLEINSANSPASDEYARAAELVENASLNRRGHQFSLSNMFAITTIGAVVALVFKATGLAAAIIDKPHDGLIGAAVIAFYGIVACGCAYTILSPGRRLALRLAGCVVGSAITAYQFAVVVLFSRTEDIAIFTTITALMAFFAGATLCYYRRLGYRLARVPNMPNRPRREPTPSEPASSPFT